MTVLELKEYLDQFNDEMEVKFSYNSGDYWRTQVAKDISDVEEGYVKYSSYHRMDQIDEDEDEDSKLVILIS